VVIPPWRKGVGDGVSRLICLLQGIVSKGKESYRRRSSLLPEEVRDSEARLAASMELYSQRCDNLGVSKRLEVLPIFSKPKYFKFNICFTNPFFS
jgi:hypothetical protein